MRCRAVGSYKNGSGIHEIGHEHVMKHKQITGRNCPYSLVSTSVTMESAAMHAPIASGGIPYNGYADEKKGTVPQKPAYLRKSSQII